MGRDGAAYAADLQEPRSDLFLRKGLARWANQHGAGIVVRADVQHRPRVFPNSVGRAFNRALHGSPVIRSFLVVEMANPGHMRGVTISFGPINRFVLGLEGPERMIRVVFDRVISNGASFGASLWTGFDKNGGHGPPQIVRVGTYGFAAKLGGNQSPAATQQSPGPLNCFHQKSASDFDQDQSSQVARSRN